MIKTDEKTLFLLGNGPSLKGVDLRCLDGRATLGMNAAYRYWREIGWRPTYYACLDTVVGLSHKEEIASLVAERGEGAIRRFLLRRNLIEALGAAGATRRVENFDALRTQDEALGIDPITTGSHAALWAARLGYRLIVLLGIDGRYKEVVDGARAAGGIELEIVAPRENPNYFFDGYQRPGDRYNLPNPRPDLHLEAWANAARALEATGAKAVNANARSAVRCFDFADLDALLEGGPVVLTPAERPARPAARPEATRSSGFPSPRRPGKAVAGVALAASASMAAAMRAPGADGPALALVGFCLCAIALMALYLRRSISVQINEVAGRAASLAERKTELRRQLAIARNPDA